MPMSSFSGVRWCSLILISTGFWWSHTELSCGTGVGVPMNHSLHHMGWCSLFNLQQGPKRVHGWSWWVGFAGAATAVQQAASLSQHASQQRLVSTYSRSRCAIPAPRFRHPLFLELVIRGRGRKWGLPLSKEKKAIYCSAKEREGNGVYCSAKEKRK